MSETNGNFEVDMEFDFVPDPQDAGGTPPTLQVEPPVPPVSPPGAPPILEEPPVPLPNLQDPPDSGNFEGTPAAAFGLALKSLTPFESLEIDPNAPIETVLEKIEDSWKSAYNKAHEDALNEYQEYVNEINLLKAGQPDPIVQLNPLKVISTIPIEVNEQVSEQIAQENRKAVILAMYTNIQQLSPEEAEILYNTAKDNSGDLVLAKKAQAQFNDFYTSSVQAVTEKVANDKKAIEDAEKASNTRLTQEISTLLNNKKLMGIEITDNDQKELQDALYSPQLISYKIKGPDGKEYARQGTRAQAFFEFFDTNPEFQMLLLHRYLKGDFNQTFIRDHRKKEVNAQIASVLNKGVAPKQGEFIEI